MTDFYLGVDWRTQVAGISEISGFTKPQIVAFAKKYLSDSNYVLVNKRQGQNTSIVKVEKAAHYACRYTGG